MNLFGNSHLVTLRQASFLFNVIRLVPLVSLLLFKEVYSSFRKYGVFELYGLLKKHSANTPHSINLYTVL